MLQLIHRFKKSLLSVVFLFLAAVSLAGLGIGGGQFGGPSMMNQSVASVDGTEISFAELSRARNNGTIPSQTALDNLVDRTLVQNYATRAGLAAGNGAIRQTLNDLAPGGITPEGLRELLSSLRMSPLELEQEIRRDAIVRQVYSLINAGMQPTSGEIEKAMKQFFLMREVSVASASITDFTAKVSNPTDAEIEQHYKDSTSDYEVPAAVKYDYVRFSPDQYLDAVPVSDDDIALYYTDHAKEFLEPATVEAKQIRMLYPKDATPTAMSELRERALRAHQRASAGESFDALALEYSDDLLTKASGGMLGTLEKGKMSPEFDAAVFGLTAPGIAPLIDAPYGFQIVQVSAVHPEKPKPIESVRDQIRLVLQKLEAPAYASTRAADLFTELRKGGESLRSFAQSRGLEVRSTDRLLNVDEDIAPALKGLTAQVLPGAFTGPLTAVTPEQIELDRETVLVQATDRRESSVAALADVREKVIATLKSRSAERLMREKAQELAKASVSEFAKLAKSLGFSTKSGLTLPALGGAAPTEVSHGNLPEALQQLSVAGVVGPVFEGSEAYVAAVTSVKEDPKVTDEQRQLYRRIADQRVRVSLGTLVEKSLLTEEKRKAKIEIKPEAYGD